MKSSLRYMAAAPKEMIGHHDMDFMMEMVFNVGKNGEVQLCFGDTIKSDEILGSQNITESAYPNEAEELQSRHGLWLSMFTRHMNEASVIEIEIED